MYFLAALYLLGLLLFAFVVVRNDGMVCGRVSVLQIAVCGTTRHIVGILIQVHKVPPFPYVPHYGRKD